MAFPFYQQLDQMDCGPTCLKMVSKFHGKIFSINHLRQKSNIGKQGSSLLGLAEAAESIGLKSLGVTLSPSQLYSKAPLPCILYWEQNHFVVLYKIIQKKNVIQKITAALHKNSDFVLSNSKVLVADPAKGLITYELKEFEESWLMGANEGLALLLQPTNAFYSLETESHDSSKTLNIFLTLKRYKSSIVQLFIGLFIGSIIQLIFPILTQSLVDVGINTKNITFIYLVLFAQLLLTLGRFSVEIIRSWILLYVSTRINLSILSEFLGKLMKLPLSFFDTKRFGDIMQRIGDHNRIEAFLTGHSINTFFSLFNLIVFSFVLFFYSTLILSVFWGFSFLYVIWVSLFFVKRKHIDIKKFQTSSKNQNAIVQLIYGMQEIKLSNSETYMRWGWERIQSKLFHLQTQSLGLSQYQQAGALLINESKNVIITFLAAKAVIDGNLTLGGMLSTQYIIGQLNSPIEQLIGFMQSFQDAHMSLERINEIQLLQNEDNNDQLIPINIDSKEDIVISNLNFKYPGTNSNNILKDISFTIPRGKTTAVVGSSGSGKTTLIKLLLKFYESYEGSVMIGFNELRNLNNKYWRSNCGAVMQDGFIFSDTIAKNIAIGEEDIDVDRLAFSIKMSNIQEFVDSLPLGLHSKIGADGNGLSQGQKQRLLIARVIYKNPEFIFFDEATNSLDSDNESTIMSNLNLFIQGKTVLIVAHRLSTVKHADQIVVLEKGHIIEVGTHDELIFKRGRYFELVKNQLELGV